MTKAEVVLWARLKRLHSLGFHFRRQRPFRGYYLDFVCIDRLLAIELDGSVHEDLRQAEHDGIRDMVLRRAGYKVMRFQNIEVFEDVDRVIELIMVELERRPSARQGDVSQMSARDPDTPTRPALRASHPPLKGRD
jgi:very-short-patch-repair endonuclease